jgi:DNA-binding MarR family transcriptional regulator
MEHSEPAKGESQQLSPREDFPLAAHLGFLLHKAALLLVEDVEAALETIGIRTRYYFVLACLGGRPRLSQQDISRLLGLDPTTVVTVIDEMERNGHVERRRDPADRRRYQLHLTDSGRERLAVIERVATGAEARFFGMLADDESTALRDILSRTLEGRWPSSVCSD